TPAERVELHQDHRPYLESLRRAGVPSTRAWVPWRKWLADARPLTTSRTISDDRGKARLALLNKPDRVERILHPAIDSIKQHDDGVVMLVGSAHDAECSGLAAEVAHICAARGAGTSLIFAPSLTGQENGEPVLAMAQEIERMVLMSGSRIAS